MKDTSWILLMTSSLIFCTAISIFHLPRIPQITHLPNRKNTSADSNHRTHANHTNRTMTKQARIRSQPYTPPRKINISRTRPEPCLRYAHIYQTISAGLGHRTGDIALTLEFAQIMDSTPAFEMFKFHMSGDHGGYSFFPTFSNIVDLMDINVILKDNPRLKKIFIPHWNNNTDLVMKNRDLCNVVFESCDNCCVGESSCFHLSSLRGYSLLPGFLQPRFDSTPEGHAHRDWMIPSMDPSCISILVHIRTGDVSRGCAGNPPLAIQMIRDVKRIIHPHCHHAFYIFQSPKPPDACLKQLCSQNNKYNCSIIHESNPLAALRLMLSTDILVSTGSSMPVVPAAMSPWVVHVASMPKSNVWGNFVLQDDIRWPWHWNINSTFTQENVTSLRNKICSRISQRRKKSYPPTWGHDENK